MDKFILFLSTKRIGSEKQRAFFVQWVKSFLSFSASAQNSDERRKYIDPFLEKMAKTKEDWQVKQAKRSILLYFHSITHAKYKTSEQNIKTNSDWSHAIEQMVHAMRLRHLSHRTEKTYINWMRQFYRCFSAGACFLRSAEKALLADFVSLFFCYIQCKRDCFSFHLKVCTRKLKLFQ